VLLTGWSLVGKGNTVKTASLGGIRLAERSKTRLLYADTQLLLTNTKYTVSLVDPLGAEVSAVSWEDAAEDRVYKSNVFTELTMHATVSRVIDGDTVEVVFDAESAPDGSSLATVRLLGVDAPESVHPTRPVEPYGMEASNALKSLLEKKKVELQFDTTNWDAYGRLLAYVRVDEQVLAQERLLSTGLARVYPDFPFARRGMFDDYEARAKALKLGMWSLPPSHVQYSLALPPALATDVRMEAQPTLSPSGSTSPALSGSDIVSMGWNTLSISEVYAHPKKGDAEWIELFNPGPATVHLHGLRLRIGQGPKAKLVRFPDGVVAAGGRIVFSDADMKLTLRDTGNMLSLVGTGSVALHAMEYPKLKAGQAWVSEADMECLSTETTPGEPGTCTLAATGAALQEGGVVRALAQTSNASPKKVPASRARAGSSPYSQQVLSSLAFPAYAPPTTLPVPSGAGPWQVFTFLLACVSLIQGTLFCVIAWKSGLLTTT
jgi:endonuclease YncB( thermonuclease family)